MGENNISFEDVESKDGVIKVGHEFIEQIRAEAIRQKTQRSLDSLLECISKGIEHKPLVESLEELDKISKDFEITEGEE